MTSPNYRSTRGREHSVSSGDDVISSWTTDDYLNERSGGREETMGCSYAGDFGYTFPTFGFLVRRLVSPSKQAGQPV